MRHKHTHTIARAKKILSAWTIACIVSTLAGGPSTAVHTAEAASSFRPTIFVNTEAFLAIDDDDTTADVTLRFGDTLAKTLSFNRALDRFEFNDDVYASGSFTASGTLVTESGAYIDGNTLVVQATSNNVGIGTATPLADLHVVGGETRLDTGTTDGTTSLSFVDNNDEKAHLLLNQATQTFDIQSDGRLSITSSDYVNLSGSNYTNIQGSTTFIGNNVGIGTTGPKTRLDVAGAISGSFVYATRSFSGAGLTDCDTAGTSKLLWDAATGRFSCGTDTDTNTTYTAGQGLSLNGTSFRLNDTVTGSVVRATTSLASSGTIVTESGAYIDGNTLVVQAGNNRVGVGTATPDTALDVVGTISGSALSVGGGFLTTSARGILTNGVAPVDDANLPIQIFGTAAQYGVSRTGGTYGLLFGSYDSTTYSMRAVQATDKLSFIVNNTTQALNIIPSGNVGIATTAPKAKLDVVGAVSGSFIYATRSFSGAGLTDCDTAGTSKLLWDATTGRFSCGTDTDTNTTYTAGQGLNLNGTSFRLNQTITGSVIQALNSLASSGSLSWKGTASGSAFNAGGGTHTVSASGASFFNTGLKNVDFAVFGRTNNALFYVDATGSGTAATASGGIGIGTRTPITQLHVAGRMPTIPQGTWSMGTGPFDVEIQGKILYSIDGSGNMKTADVSNASSPVSLGTLSGMGSPTDIAVNGSYAYVTTGLSVKIIDVSNPRNPTLVSTTPGLSGAAGYIVASGPYIYVTDAGGALTTMDVSNPTAPTVTSTLTAGGKLSIDGNYLYAADGGTLRVFNLRNPAAPFQQGTLAVTNASHAVGQGRYVYVARYDSSALSVVDVSDPSNPVAVGSVTVATPRHIAVSGRRVFVADLFNKLSVLDVGSPVAPSLIGSVNSGGSSVVGIAVSGRYAYLANRDSQTITIFDVGGAYAEHFEAGSVEVGSLAVRNNIIASDGTFRGAVSAMRMFIAGNGAFSGSLKLGHGLTTSSGNILFSRSGSVVFNEQSRPVDFRIESDNDPNAFMIDASADRVGIGTATPKAKLDVVGTISGAFIYATRSFSGAGLTDCDTAGTSKLLWDATTGRFSCGTDQSGAGGMDYATASGIFLKRSGGTMTGSLSIQSGNAAAATLATLLNVRGTMSGKSLTVMGTGATALLSTTTGKPTVRIGGSGSLVIENRSADPGSAPANASSLFSQKVGGRSMLHQGSGSTFAASPLQNALFGNLIMSLSTGAGTTVSGYGTTVTNDTTVSHPAAGETFGYMTNFATAATNGDEAGTSSTTAAFFRGSAAGANGFFYYARVGVVDTTSITVFSGMADQTIATMVGADNPAGNHVGFQFSTSRGDTNWMFTTKDNTTQNVNSTGMAFTANKVYDLTFTCTKQCASITWEIRNVTDGTSAQGTTSNNLPTAGSALRIVLGVEAETTTAKNIRMQQIYVEADR